MRIIFLVIRGGFVGRTRIGSGAGAGIANNWSVRSNLHMSLPRDATDPDIFPGI